MPLLVTKHTDNILRDISLRLESGEHLLILGANGAGKTTLAKRIAGLRPSDAVTIEGRSPYHTYGATRARLVNYIPPKLDVFDDYLTVEAFLALGHFNEALTINEALRLCGIAHLASHRCVTLSSGEGQLVLFASALLHGARYTLFDEPAANLDPVKLKRIFNLLQTTPHLHSRIVITHHLDMAYKLGYRVCAMEQGRIVFNGAHEAFFDEAHLQRFYNGAVAVAANHAVVTL